MSKKLISLLNDKTQIQDIKIEYSNKSKILCVFSDKSLYIIDNIIEDPNIRLQLDIQLNIKKTILNPKSENQLLIISEESIFIINDLKKFSKKEDIHKLNINNKNIVSIKFAYFDNCFGVLYKDRTFIYYLLKEDNNLEEICNIKDFDTDYIDFNFCPLFSKGFEIFMIFFMKKDGTINMYGPFFPNEFYIPKEYIFNMENYLIYRLGSMENNNNNPENTIYCLSLNVIDDLKKSKIGIIDSDSDSNKDNDYIRISDKMKVFNSTFRKREIKIHNNFLLNNDTDIINKNYKQIHILNNKPLTILRISDKNDIDIIMLGEEIMPLELAQTGNFTFITENSINNFFIEFIKLDNIQEKQKIKIMQYNNEELIIKTQNSLFLIKIPYLNKLKTIAEEQLKDIPNKMNKTTIIKLFKWNNDKNQNRNQKKSINICDILIVPDLKQLLVFGILREKKEKKEKNNAFGYSYDQKQKAPSFEICHTLKIKEKKYDEEEKKSDLSKFNNILNEKTEYDNQINILKNKLNENDFINSSKIRKIKLEVDEEILENNNINFENELNNQMNIIYKAYKDLIQNNEVVFKQKINIMKNIYNNLSQSQIKQTIDETIKKINKLKSTKTDILKKKETIEKKIISIKEKIGKYELNDDEINNYLKILGDYQRTVGDKLNSVERKIIFLENNIDKIFSFTNLFPNFDLDFNLIEKDNQEKYLEFEKKVLNNSKNIKQALKNI